MSYGQTWKVFIAFEGSKLVVVLDQAEHMLNWMAALAPGSRL